MSHTCRPGAARPARHVCLRSYGHTVQPLYTRARNGSLPTLRECSRGTRDILEGSAGVNIRETNLTAVADGL